MRTAAPFWAVNSHNTHNHNNQYTASSPSAVFNPTATTEVSRPATTRRRRGERSRTRSGQTSGVNPEVSAGVDPPKSSSRSHQHRRRTNHFGEKATKEVPTTPKQRQLHKLSEAAAFAVANSVSPQHQQPRRQAATHQQRQQSRAVPNSWFSQPCLYNTTVPTAAIPTTRRTVEEYRQPSSTSNSHRRHVEKTTTSSPAVHNKNKQPLVSALRKGSFGNKKDLHNKFHFPETNSILETSGGGDGEFGLVTPVTSNTGQYQSEQRRLRPQQDPVELRRQGYRYEDQQVVDEEDNESGPLTPRTSNNTEAYSFRRDQQLQQSRKFDKEYIEFFPTRKLPQEEEIIVLDDIVYDSVHGRLIRYNDFDEEESENLNKREQLAPEATAIEEQLLQLGQVKPEEREEENSRTAARNLRRQKRQSRQRNDSKKNKNKPINKQEVVVTTEDNNSCASSCGSLVGSTPQQDREEHIRRLLVSSPKKKSATVTVDPIGGVVGQVRTQQPQITPRQQQLARRRTNKSIYDTLHCVEPIDHKSYSKDVLLQASNSSTLLDKNNKMDEQQVKDADLQLEPLPLQELGPLEEQFLSDPSTSRNGAAPAAAAATASASKRASDGLSTPLSSGTARAMTNVEVQYAGSSVTGTSSAASSSGVDGAVTTSASSTSKSGTEADDEDDRRFHAEKDKRRIKQEEIDQLRNRVDNVLHQLVQGGSGDVAAMREGPSLLLSRGSFTTNSTGLTPAGAVGGNGGGGVGDPLNPILVPSTLSGLDNNNDSNPRSQSQSIYSQRKYAILQELESATSMISQTSTAAVGDEQDGKNRASKTTTANKTPVGQKTWVVDKYGDQGEYQGEFLLETVVDKKKRTGDGDSTVVKIPHGMGTMYYSDGRIFSGEWEQGTWHGEGRAVFSNGDIFEGTYHHDQRHGPGCYWWKDGRIYDGGFRFDQRDGLGEYSWPDGAHYKGAFHKGLRHGEGRYVFQDGSVYTGEWLRGKYHGVGEVRVFVVKKRRRIGCVSYEEKELIIFPTFPSFNSVIGRMVEFTRVNGRMGRHTVMGLRSDRMAQFVMTANGRRMCRLETKKAPIMAATKSTKMSSKYDGMLLSDRGGKRCLNISFTMKNQTKCFRI